MRAMKTGGRKKGTPNKATAARRAMAEAGISFALSMGTTPLEVILLKMRGGPEASRITEEQFRAAMAAAPYVHPRLNASHVTSDVGSGRMSHEQRLAYLERLPQEPGPQIEGQAEEPETR